VVVSRPGMTMRWLREVDEATVRQVHRVVGAVVDQGGAVGWLHTPTIRQTERWLSTWTSASAEGRAGLVFAAVNDRIEALGGWRAAAEGPVGHVSELTKVMAHPTARGLGLGRLVVDALIDGASSFGTELLVLGVRGNNHGARALYERCGFTVWGVLPNGVAVGNDRFDDVRMYRQLCLPDAAVIRGLTPGGAGGSAPTRNA